ncbi:MAG TPA: hypothetical protein VLJ39_20780 [Tepidisphaeraceae bacterium]|nr:hypothetical protein [Tepidisphaeraceae bacterium]
MRGMFGLVSLLVVLGICLMIFKMIEAPTLEKGKETQDKAQQMSGRGTDGNSVMSSFKADPQQQGSRLNSLLVTDVTPHGAVDEFYGLKTGDKITGVTMGGSMTKIGDASNDDAEMAKIKVQEAYQSSGPITVVRNGQTLTLPTPAGSTAAAQPAGQPQPGAPAQQPKQPQSVYDQVNGIKNSIPGQQ